MANAGTWLDRPAADRAATRRACLEGLRSAAGGADIEALSAGIGGLAKRQFMLVSARSNQPVVFSTRDTRSRLTGPLTRERVAAVTPDVPVAAPVVVSDSGTPVAPPRGRGRARRLGRCGTPPGVLECPGERALRRPGRG